MHRGLLIEGNGEKSTRAHYNAGRRLGWLTRTIHALSVSGLEFRTSGISRSDVVGSKRHASHVSVLAAATAIPKRKRVDRRLAPQEPGDDPCRHRVAGADWIQRVAPAAAPRARRRRRSPSSAPSLTEGQDGHAMRRPLASRRAQLSASTARIDLRLAEQPCRFRRFTFTTSGRAARPTRQRIAVRVEQRQRALAPRQLDEATVERSRRRARASCRTRRRPPRPSPTRSNAAAARSASSAANGRGGA